MRSDRGDKNISKSRGTRRNICCFFPACAADRLVFFFSSRRRHTRLTCDWSSDVYSSDLRRLLGERDRRNEQRDERGADRSHGPNIRPPNETGPGRRPGPAPDATRQTLRTFCACKPLGPWATSNSTVSPSARLRKPSAWIAVKWTNTSGPDPCAIKQKPFASLNHFTLPFAILCQTPN